MTVEEFLNRHPDLRLKYGRSSENEKWWADARNADGHCIALSGKATLGEAVSALDADWTQRKLTPPRGMDGLKEKPTLPKSFPRDIVSYGSIESLETSDPEDAE